MLVAELLEQVGTRINSRDNVVVERVVDTLVEKELEARKDAVLVVLGKLDEAKRAAAKIKPDHETWPAGEDGRPIDKPVKVYSKAKKEELDKNDRLQKGLVDALEKAFAGDFSKVKELSKAPAKGEAPTEGG